MLKHKLTFGQAHLQSSINQEKMSVHVKTSIHSDRIKVSISKDAEEVWDFRSNTASLLQSESETRTIMIPTLNPYKVVHEVVALLLSPDSTDKKLMSIKQPPYDSAEIMYLNMTPDFILHDPLRIVELGTTRASSLNSFSESYNSKYAETRLKIEGANVRCPIAVVIVGPIGVYSNIRFSEREVSQLLSAFRLGQMIYSEVCEKYSLRPTDDVHSLNEKIERFKLCMVNHNLPQECPAPRISYAMLKGFESQMANLDTKEIAVGIMKMVSESTKLLEPNQLPIFKEQFKSLPMKARGSLKAPVQLPLFHMTHGSSTPSILLNEEDAYIRLWNSILRLGPADENLSEVSFESTSDGKWKMRTMRSFSKRLCFVNEKDMMIFSEVGLFGKRNKTEQFMKEKRIESQKSFGILDDTNDINQFILGMENVQEYNDDLPASFINLVLEQRDENFCNEVLSNIQEFYNTTLGRYLFHLSILAQELNMDIIKKMPSNTFLFKRVADYDMWYIARSTGSHLFFSLMLKGNDNRRLGFKEPRFTTKDGYSVYDFISTDSHRISTMLNCFEVACAIRADLESKYSDLTDPDHYIRNCKLKFGIMMMLENKQTTADSIYNLRQMYVKIASGSPYANPGSLFKKTEQLRSRFAVWVMKRIYLNFIKMIELRPAREIIDGEESDTVSNNYSNDIFVNLIDIVSGRPEVKFENAIYTSYLACLHSPGTMSKTAAEAKVLIKVTKYELMMEDADRNYMGTGSFFGKNKVHEFNLKTSLLGGKLKRQHLENIYGASTNTMIWEKFFSSMTTSYSEFATFKASLEERVTFHASVKQPKSSKAIEQVIETAKILINTLTSPYQDLVELFRYIFRPIQAKVDKKMDQANGLREILTMLMMSRYGIKVVEKFIELLNQDSPSEILSKGALKESTLESFDREVSLMQEDGFIVITVDMIIDHSKWCQYFVMSKFASHLYPVLPKEILEFICLILNAITEKKILMSDAMVVEMLKDPLYFDETLSEVRDQFLGRKHGNLVEPFKIAIKNESNMGQGWLHNLSSSDGDADMQIVSFMIDLVVKSLKSKQQLTEDCTYRHFKIGSSDDQYQKLVFKCRESDVEVIRGILPHMSLLPPTVASLNNKSMGDEKCSLLTLTLIWEFNQIFRSGNTTFVATNKFVRAALEIPVTKNIRDRFSNFSNTRRNMLENGCDMRTIAITQVLQAHLHYRSLGMYTAKAFDEYSRMLLLKPHPSFGFFCQEPDNIIGISGNSMSEYHWFSKSRSALMINSSLLKRIDMCLGVEGSISPSISYRLTKTDKFNNFAKKYPDVSMELRLNPVILYRDPEDRDENFLCLYSKARSPDAELSFVYESSPKVFQAAAYFLTEPVLRVSGPDFDATEIKKISIGFLMNSIDYEHTAKLDDLHILFPHAALYDKQLALAPKFHQMTLYASEDIARRRSFIRLDELTEDLEVPLIDCVKEKWFGIRSKFNSRLVTESFQRYKDSLTWLRDTHDDTMKAGGLMFETAESLHGVILALKSKLTPIKLFSPLKQLSPEYMLSNLVQYNWQRHKKTFIDKKVSYPGRVEVAHMANISVGPFDPFEKEAYLKSIVFNEDFLLTRDRNIKNLIIAKSVLELEPPGVVFQKIRTMRNGMLTYFIVPQRKVDDQWAGDCVLLMTTSNGSVRFEVSNNMATLFAENRKVAHLDRVQIISELRKLGFENMMVSNGMRMGEMGLLTFSRGLGYRLSFNDRSRSFAWNPDNMNLRLKIENDGQFKILNTHGNRAKEVIYKFYLDARNLPAHDKEEFYDSYKDYWKYNVEMPLDQIALMLDEYPEITKGNFKKKIENVLSLDVQENSDQIVDESPFNEDAFDKILELIDLEVDDMEINDELLKADVEMDFGDVDFQTLMYQPHSEPTTMLSNMTVLGTHCFDKVLDYIYPMNIKSIYTAKTRIELRPCPEINIFKNLIDYDRRPLSKEVSIVLATCKDSSYLRELLPGMRYITAKTDKLIINGEVFQLVGDFSQKASMVRELLKSTM